MNDKKPQGPLCFSRLLTERVAGGIGGADMARRILKHIGGYAHGKEAVAEAKNGVPPVFKILGPDERLPHKSILASQTVLDVELSDGQRWQIPMSSLQT